MTVTWLIVLAVMILIEVNTMALTTIWFGFGAIGAAIASALGLGFWGQLLIFAVVSVITMALFRPIAIKRLNTNQEKTNVDSMVGKTAVVIEVIDNEHATGRVTVEGMDWTARSQDGSRLEVDEKVRVVSVQGVKLFVEK